MAETTLNPLAVGDGGFKITPPDPETPDDGEHNADNHHHHEHTTDGDDLAGGADDELNDPSIDTFDSTYQSAVLYSNKLNIEPYGSIFPPGHPNENEVNPGVAKIKFTQLGFNPGSDSEWSQNSHNTFNFMNAIITQYQDFNNNNSPKLAVQPHSFYKSEDAPAAANYFFIDMSTSVLDTFKFEYNYVDGALLTATLEQLPFPQNWNEFDVFNNGEYDLDSFGDDAAGNQARSDYINNLQKFWGVPGIFNSSEDIDGVGRPDITMFIVAFYNWHYNPNWNNHQSLESTINWMNELYTLPDYCNTYLETGIIPNNYSNSQESSFYYNFETALYSFEIDVPPANIFDPLWPSAPFDPISEEPITGSVDVQINFKIVGHETIYEDIDFGLPPVVVDEEVEDSVNEDLPENNILVDTESTDEEISLDFGVPNVVIEQTLFSAYNSLTGLNINIDTFQNTRQGFLDSNEDGRIGLGMFTFDDDNILTSNMPSVFRDDKFTQVRKINLVPNPSGKFIKSIWRNPYSTGDDEDQRERFFIPSNNWSYCTYDGIGEFQRRRNDDLYRGGDGRALTTLYGTYPENLPNGSELITSFQQNPAAQEQDWVGFDSQGAIGYTGYHAYFFDYRIDPTERQNQSLLRLQDNLINSSKSEILGSTETVFDSMNYFLRQNQIDSTGDEFDSILEGTAYPAVSSHRSYLTPRKCTATGMNDTDEADDVIEDIWFPNFAKWIIDKDFSEEYSDEVSCFSNGRCLEFLATNFRDGQFDINNFGDDNKIDTTFDWKNDFDMNVQNGGVTDNQYRGLNQVIKIYNPWADERINPFTTMKVKFKMKTWSKLYNSNNPPQVEIAIVDGDTSTTNPIRTEDRKDENPNYTSESWVRAEGRHLPWSAETCYWPHGDFNSQRYSDDINDTGTLNRKYSNFGSMGRFQNTELDTWETFSYNFTMADIFRYGDGIIRPLYLIVQSANEFYGRVWLDDFEVYEDEDFIPDVDVRKKLSVGNYGKGNLTKYYDPTILSQLEKYNDTTAPLEAQFYFYPQYPVDNVFDVKRTPVYQDFKKGLFYIYNINWGDGSPNEFKSNPEKIDEEKALYHTYESSGVFEVVGTMIRMKVNEKGEEIGIITNKKFRLRINISEGLDEDFTFFGSDGFSFIPYKNASPIIGGISYKSSYYKSIKRQLGFIGGNDVTRVDFTNLGDRLKTEIALNKMDSSFNSQLDLLNEYTKPRTLAKLDSGELLVNPLCEDYDCNISAFLHPENMFDPPLTRGVMNCHPNDTACNEYYGIGAIAEMNENNNWVSDNLTTMVEGFTYRFGTINQGVSHEFCHPSLGCTGFGSGTSIPFAGGAYLVELDGSSTISQYSNYEEFKTLTSHEINYTGFKVFSEELGKSIGDLNIGNPKFYNTAKSMSEMLGFEVPNIDDFTSEYGGELITNGDFSTGELSSWNIGYGEHGNVEYSNGGVRIISYDAGTDNNAYARQEILTPGKEYIFTYDVIDISSTDDTDRNMHLELIGGDLEIPNTLPTDEPSTGNSMTFTADRTMFVIKRGGKNTDVTFDNISVREKINTESIEFETQEEALQASSLIDSGNPESPRYWKNIIPKDYSIYNREGLDDDLIDTYSEQEWLDNYYYPVLPKYGSDGKFIEGNFPNNKIPFPLEGPITDENESNKNLLINITSEKIEGNVFNDNSGNQNIGFGIVDFKPKFNNKTLKPKKRKSTELIKTSTNNGAF